MRNKVQYPVLNTRIKIYDTKTLYSLTLIEQLNDLYYGKDIMWKILKVRESFWKRDIWIHCTQKERENSERFEKSLMLISFNVI